MELTKEYFEEYFESHLEAVLNEKLANFGTKEDLKNSLLEQTKTLQVYTDEVAVSNLPYR